MKRKISENYLNALVVKDIIEWYDFPVQYTAIDNIGNLYLLTVIEFDDEEYNDIYQIQNINNVYEYLYTVRICRITGKNKTIIILKEKDFLCKQQDNYYLYIKLLIEVVKIGKLY